MTDEPNPTQEQEGAPGKAVFDFEPVLQAESATEKAGVPAEERAAEEWFSPQVISKPEIRVIDEEGKGKLLTVGTWRVCVMEGTPQEMGFQHGRLLARSIRGMVHERYMAITLIGKNYTKDYVNEQAARMEKHFPPEYVEELKALAKGIQAAGVDDVSYEDLRAGVCAAELQHYPPDAPPGCSNFAVFGRWTEDGRLLHGRNLDWTLEGRAQEDAVLLVWKPSGGIPFMMVGWAGCIGSVSGMNAQGITIGEMTSRTQDESFDGLPLFLIMRRVLEKASSLDEAIAVIQDSPRTLGWNFILCDGKVPDARALEVDHEDCAVFSPMDPGENGTTGHTALPDAVRRTNHPCGEVHLKKVAAAYGKEQGEDLSDWDAARPLVKEHLPQGNSWKRYHWLGEQIQANAGRITVEKALELLANGPVGSSPTLHSWVFDPLNRAAYVANAGADPVLTATRLPYIRIDLAEWFR